MNMNDVKRVAVIGAGTMGSGISLSFAVAGYQVSMMSRTQKTLDHSAQVMKTSLKTMAEYGTVKESDIPSILGRVTPRPTLLKQ